MKVVELVNGRFIIQRTTVFLFLFKKAEYLNTRYNGYNEWWSLPQDARSFLTKKDADIYLQSYLRDPKRKQDIIDGFKVKK